METEKKPPTDYKLLVEILIQDIERMMKEHEADIELHRRFTHKTGENRLYRLGDVHQEYYERHVALKQQLEQLLYTINLYR